MSSYSSDAVSARANTLFDEAQNAIHRRADRLFANLMVIQWVAGIVAALWISPRTWIGASSQTHWHVWAAIFLGGAITAFPVFLVWTQPGRPLTRHVIAVAQMLTSALLIHLTGGRIETHFHVFGSLAFFAFYRDWRVLVTATVVVALDHMMRGIFWPQSVFGVLTTSPWRWLEHAGWVIFEDTFLFISIRQSLSEMLEVAQRRAGLETLNAQIEHQVMERTAELTAAHKELQSSENRLRMILEAEPECVKLVDRDGLLLEINPAGLRMVEAERAEDIVGTSVYGLISDEHREMFRNLNEAVFRGESMAAEFEIMGLKGTRRWMETQACPLRDTEGKIFAHLGVTRDITKRKLADAQLEKAHQDLLQSSRMAGMAEVATGVLHNVGNVLNSVNVSATLLAEKVKKSKSATLSRIADLLREHETELGTFITSDPQGRQVPNLIGSLAQRLASEQAALLEEIGQIRKNVEHIKEVVGMQQSFAKVSGLTETLSVKELIEDTLRLNAESLSRHQIKVVREFANVPPIAVDKHRLLQILVNLVRNAKHACTASDKPDRQVTLRLFNGDGRLKISVADNGVGIPAENLTRIFNHGFTTKHNGHGFGLHSGALAAREMGGSLSVFSEGQGRGATFMVELPLSPPKQFSA